MALHNFVCPRCGVIARDIYVPITEGARAAEARLFCRHCAEGAHVGVHLEWIPQIGRMDASSGPSFKSFQTFDAFNKTKITISSLHQLRALERESEQRARDGEGQHVVWPAYSNEPSNMDTHAIAGKWTDHPDLPPPGKRGVTIRAADDVKNQRAASPEEGT